MKNEIKVGTKLIAIDKCFIDEDNESSSTLIIGNEYHVSRLSGDHVYWIDESGTENGINVDYLFKYFKLAEPTYTLTAEQLKEIAEDGAKVKDMFPEVFDAKLEIGKWYKGVFEGAAKVLRFFISTDYSGCVKTYGFNYGGKWTDDRDKGAHYGSIKDVDDWQLATNEEVTAALEKECIKRFGEDWKNAKIEAHADGEDWTGLGLNDGHFYSGFQDEKMYSIHGVLFHHGKWAEPLPDITTVSLDKAKKILAKKYNTTPDKIEIK